MTSSWFTSTNGNSQRSKFEKHKFLLLIDVCILMLKAKKEYSALIENSNSCPKSGSNIYFMFCLTVFYWKFTTVQINQ